MCETAYQNSVFEFVKLWLHVCNQVSWFPEALSVKNYSRHFLILAQDMLPCTSCPRRSEVLTQAELPMEGAASHTLSWTKCLLPLAETGPSKNVVLAHGRCVLGWGFLLPSRWDALGGQQSTWHQRWQKGNWIFFRTQTWAFNLQLYRGEGQAEYLLFCDGQHWKLVTSHNWNFSFSACWSTSIEYTQCF